MFCFDLNDSVLLAKRCYLSTDEHSVKFVNITCLLLIKMSSKTPKGYISVAKTFY